MIKLIFLLQLLVKCASMVMRFFGVDSFDRKNVLPGIGSSIDKEDASLKMKSLKRAYTFHKLSRYVQSVAHRLRSQYSVGSYLTAWVLSPVVTEPFNPYLLGGKLNLLHCNHAVEGFLLTPLARKH